MWTQVPLSDAPVTMASNRSPILGSSSIAAADFPTCRSTFFAASSSSVQCFANASKFIVGVGLGKVLLISPL